MSWTFDGIQTDARSDTSEQNRTRLRFSRIRLFASTWKSIPVSDRGYRANGSGPFPFNLSQQVGWIFFEGHSILIFVAGFNLDGAGSNDLQFAYYAVVGK